MTIGILIKDSLHCSIKDEINSLDKSGYLNINHYSNLGDIVYIVDNSTLGLYGTNMFIHWYYTHDRVAYSSVVRIIGEVNNKKILGLL